MTEKSAACREADKLWNDSNFKCGNGGRKLDPGTERKAKFARIVLGQVPQNRFVNAIVPKYCLKAFKPLQFPRSMTASQPFACRID
jgi:hypothetical protein